jgi:hypothetical protein
MHFIVFSASPCALHEELPRSKECLKGTRSAECDAVKFSLEGSRTQARCRLPSAQVKDSGNKTMFTRN